MRKSKGGMLQKLRKSIPAIKTLLETIRVFSATCTNFQERLLRPRYSVINHKYICVCLVDLTSSSRVWFCKTQKEPWVIGPSLVASSSPLKMCVVVKGERNNFMNKEKNWRAVTNSSFLPTSWCETLVFSFHTDATHLLVALISK